MSMNEALEQVREGFSAKEIKMAIGIASDKRYAGNNMSGAVDAIEKIKSGLSDNPKVAAVLKKQNEDVDMQEGRMKELHHHIKMGKSAKEIAKIMKLDFKTINSLVDGLTYESVEEGTESLDEDVTLSFPWKDTDKSLNTLMKVLKPGSALNKTINLTVKVDSEMKKMSALLSKVNDIWEQVDRKVSEGQKNESFEQGTESLDEKYDLYHKTFSGAMQHSYEYAKKKFGIEIDPNEIDDKVAMGPAKPKNGKTNSYRLKGKNGKGIQVQVYNTGTSFELNMYKESVDDVNEDKRADDKKRTAKELSKKDFIKAYTHGMDDKISKKDFVKRHGTEQDVASYWDSMNESYGKMNSKKDEVPAGHHRMPDGSIMKDSEMDEASKEGTIRIIDLGNRNQDKIRKNLGVDKLGDSGFQVQVMTKGKFVNVGKPYKTMKDAEKVRKSGQHSLPLDEKVLAGKGEYKIVKKGDDIKIMLKGKEIGTADFDGGSDSFFASITGVKGQKSFNTAQAIADYFAKKKIVEGWGSEEFEESTISLGMFNNKGAKHEDAEQNQDDRKITRIAQLQLQIAKAKQTLNKLNNKED